MLKTAKFRHFDDRALFHDLARLIGRSIRLEPRSGPEFLEPASEARGLLEIVKAAYIGPPLSDTINHSAPTLCMNVPTSETKFAVSKLPPSRV
jgi:hypothetical protein